MKSVIQAPVPCASGTVSSGFPLRLCFAYGSEELHQATAKEEGSGLRSCV